MRWPRLEPCTTRPKTLTGRPSMAEAVGRSPSSTASRMTVDETGRPRIEACGDTSTSNPRARRDSGVPPRSRPNLLSKPRTKLRTPSPRTAISRANSAAVRARRAASKFSTTVCSMPARSKSSSRCSRVVRVFGARPSRRRLGWRRKVTTVGTAPKLRARATFVPRMAWWPRWTPSNMPTETTAPRGSGFSRSRRKVAIILRSSAARRADRGRLALVLRDQLLQGCLVPQAVGGRHTVDQEHALEVVVLVLDDAAREAAVVLLEGRPVRSLGLHEAAPGPRALVVDAGEGEAPLLEQGRRAGAPEDARIDENELVLLLARRVQHEDALLQPDLGGGEPDALAGVHALEHAGHDRAQLLVEGLHREGRPAQERIGVQRQVEVQLRCHPGSREIAQLNTPGHPGAAARARRVDHSEGLR